MENTSLFIFVLFYFSQAFKEPKLQLGGSFPELKTLELDILNPNYLI